jgi:hypothetical protein
MKPAIDPRLYAVLATPLVGLLGLWGCNQLLDTGGYHVTETGSDSSVDSGHGADAGTDGSGGGDGCTQGTTRHDLENECTNAECAPFGATVPSCEGGLCTLLPPDGSTPPVDAGDAGSPSDAAPDTFLGNPCSAIQPSPVFVTGSTALKDFVNEVSKALATQPTNPVTIIYQQSGSCIGVKAAIDPANNLMVPSLGPATYYDGAGTQHTCDLDPSNGIVADIGASDVFFTTCYIGAPVVPPLPQDISENFGPIQIMNFAVAQASSQHTISINAAYYVFGFGGATGYQVAPWTNPAQLEIRSSTSGTQSMIAAAINVPPAQWWGTHNKKSTDVVAALVAAGQSGDQTIIDSTIGIMSSDFLIQNPQTLRGLAVLDENASCAYYPSSTGTARDFQNTRDGHYPLWGPSHFYARVDPTTKIPTKGGTSQFIDGLAGVTALPGVDLVGEYASKGLVPTCAMHVTRNSDGADYTPAPVPKTCNCYFDLIATGATSCQKCSSSSDCAQPTPNCNAFGPPPQQGYCDQ